MTTREVIIKAQDQLKMHTKIKEHQYRVGSQERSTMVQEAIDSIHEDSKMTVNKNISITDNEIGRYRSGSVD